MQEQQHTEELPAPHPERRVNITFRHTTLLELDAAECEILGELRALLGEHPLVRLHPNFAFTAKGAKLREFEPLSAQLASEDAHISIALELVDFNERTGREHVSEVCALLLCPHKYVSESYMDFSITMGRTDVLGMCIEAQDLSRLPDFADSLDKTDLTALGTGRFNRSEPTVDGSFRKLAYSEHNPVVPGVGALGDMLYLDFVDRSGRYSCIAISSRGVYRNESSATTFNDKPSTRAYYSLLELLAEICPELATELKPYVDISENFAMKKLAQTDFYGEPSKDWLHNPATLSTRCRSLLNTRAQLSTSVHGKSTTTYRDWVEEFHNCRALPAQDTLQQVHKIKVLRKTHADFTAAAEELARAVVGQRLQPLNPNDNRVESCYVYNNLFATYALDSTSWELPRSETAPTTYNAVDADIRNLAQILDSDLPDVNVINTAAVDYRGCRVIVQSVVQGILHFDQKTWNCYGSIDDGKTMNKDEEFHDIIGRLSDYFYLSKENKYVDTEGVEHRLHGSPEVKGIKAGDGRKYVMDLMRLSVRDANYSDAVQHECCLVRPELLANYVFLTSFEKQQAAEQKTEIKAQDEAKVEENGKENDEEAKIEETKVEDNKEQQPQETLPRTLITLNPSLLTQVQSVNDNSEEELKQLQQLADFLTKQMIPTFLSGLVSSAVSAPLDIAGLTDTMHKLGINVRYIGKIYAVLNKKAYPHLARLMQRFVLVRSIKKILRAVALAEDTQTFSECFAQYLNLLLGNDLVRSMVDDKINNNGSPAKPAESKNKKKKNKKRAVETKSASELSAHLRVNSASLLTELSRIATERYGFPTEEFSNFNTIECVQSHADKLAVLREVCLCFGAVLRAKEYDFAPSERQPEYPVKARDVLNFTPQSKSAHFSIEGLKYNYKNAEAEMSRKNLDRAGQLYRGCQQLILSAYGILNADFVYVTNKLATLAFLSQDIETAAKTQLFAVKVAERVFGPSHPSTALHILELSNYLYERKAVAAAVALHTRALKIFDVCGSSANPNSLLVLHELQLMTEELRDYNASCVVMQELLTRNSTLYGDTDERLLFALAKLAQLKAELGDFKQASLLQARHAFILRQLLKVDTEGVSDKLREAFNSKLDESEKMKAYYVSKSKLVANASK